MKIKILACIATLAIAPALLAKHHEGWVSLFDGKTLDGWTQLNGTATYEVEDGAIVGRTAVGSPNSFLCSDKQYGDFELEFEVLCDVGLNSGVQIRSRQKGAENVDADAKEHNTNTEGRVFGPQIEIETSPGEAAYVYGEATEFKWLSRNPEGGNPVTHSHYKNGEWNSFRVIAKGVRIQTFLNGIEIEDISHEGIYETHPKGFLGLQVHGIGKKEESFSVAWRNIRIKELK